MDGGDSETAHPFDQLVIGIVCVQSAQLGLNGSGSVNLILVLLLVIQSRKADRGVGIDQTGDDHFGFKHPQGCWNDGVPEFSNELDLSVFYDHNAVTNGPADHGIDNFSMHSELGVGVRNQSARNKHGE